MEQRGNFGDNRWPGGSEESQSGLQEAVLRVGIWFAVCLVLVSALPAPLALPVLSELLQFSALTALLAAALRGERLASNRLNNIDVAAALLLLALACSFFVDTEAVQAFLDFTNPEPKEALNHVQ